MRTRVDRSTFWLVWFPEEVIRRSSVLPCDQDL